MPRFAGRSRELDTIDGLWDSVSQGGRATLFLGGAPGAGKTRLATEAAAAAAEQGATVLHGRCFSDYVTPLQPIAEAFQGIESLAADEDAVLVDHVLNQPIEQQQPTATRGQLVAAVVSVLERLAANAPVVLVIDDLHWASPTTLDLLTHIVRARRPGRLLIIATFRTTAPDRSHELTGTVAELYRLADVHRIDLEGLSVEEIADFLDSRSAGPQPDLTRAAAVLRDHTGGNPFFLTEVWDAAGDLPTILSGRVAIPPTVNDALETRFRTLGEDAMAVLRVAALYGPEIDSDVVAEASGQPTAVALSGLDAAVRAGLITSQPGGHVFAHDLTRQAVGDSIPRATQSQMHEAIADALLRRHGNVPASAARIGRHLAATGAGERRAEAVVHLTRAATYAASRLAFEEAADHLQHAATLTADTSQRDGLLLDAADSLVKATSYVSAEQLYAAGCSSADPQTKARAAIGLEDTHWRPGWDASAAVNALQEADAMLGEDGPEALRIELRASLSRALAYSDRMEEAESIGDAVLERAQRFGDDRLLAKALLFPVTMRNKVARDDLDRARRAATIAQRSDDLRLLAQASFVRGSTAYALGERTEWDAATADLVMCMKRSGDALDRIGCQLATMCAAYSRGDLAGAADTLFDIEHHGVDFGAGRLDSLVATGMFMIRRETGLEDVRALMTGKASTEPGTWGLGRLALYTELGMTDPAKHLLTELLSGDRPGVAGHKYRGSDAAFLTDAVVAVGNAQQAALLYESLAHRSGTNLITGHFSAVFGSADRYLAMLAAKAGEEAEEHFEKAIAMDEQMGATLHQAETMARYAAWLNDRDPQRATAVAAQARRLADRSQSARIATMVDSVQAAADRWLTKREVGVLRLVAAGMSNKQISRELFISPNTVANHVRNILIKTGTANRTQASRYGAKHGLLE